jgi:3-hydroxyisobutyrate dehydrogenase
MVGFPKDVEEVVLGNGNVLNDMKSGGVLVDMTTSQPSLAIKMAEIGKKRGVYVLDAPVNRT